MYLVSISQMEVSLRLLGKGNSYSIVNSENIWMPSGVSDMKYSGDEISIVHIMRSIWHVLEKMMGKSDSILSNGHGSIIE